ncbi:hypothetical protein IFM46972_05065 [Aspergillus udagawae]|uniref:Uncharacterized protein n=1 Tax=Aspergillus udagawae TaxID=91492 RepID=A0A8H3RT50_9EURO|nr:hypothetical protein IFM46972_05065 [Aspergillus udagawae]
MAQDQAPKDRAPKDQHRKVHLRKVHPPKQQPPKQQPPKQQPPKQQPPKQQPPIRIMTARDQMMITMRMMMAMFQVSLHQHGRQKCSTPDKRSSSRRSQMYLSRKPEQSEELQGPTTHPATGDKTESLIDVGGEIIKSLEQQQTSDPSGPHMPTPDNTGELDDVMSRTPKKKQKDIKVLAAVEKRVKSAQQAAQGLTYSPFLFMPDKYRVADIDHTSMSY